ncbi:MAG: hypothetical protein JW953_24590 [Anaerolineae bacterium]|nr:hypothetical protein [Anaerolineae bacterium]
MPQQILYEECPLCNQGRVAWHAAASVYRCERCGLTLHERTVLGLFKKGRLGVAQLAQGDYHLARQSLAKVALRPAPLQVVLGNVYADSQLAALAAGALAVLRPVRTVVARIIFEQLNETCLLQVNGLRRGHGQPLTEGGSFRPVELVPRRGMAWQDEGNLFCTNQRLVFPSNRFTFIRLDRKLAGVQAFRDGLAIQRQGEEFATYFVDCYLHEATLVAAYVMAQLPKLRAETQETSPK